MTTLALMKARIHAETRRPATNAVYASAVAGAITTAIDAYSHVRFRFSETRANTLNIVIAQEFYTSADASALARLTKIDYVHLILNGQSVPLCPKDPDWMEQAAQTGSSTGDPYNYCWYGDALRLNPVPSEARVVRIGGVFNPAPPASEDETSNPWMVAAETLIRSRAKWELYTHVLADDKKSAIFNPMNENGPTGLALKALKGRATQMMGSGIVPMPF